MARGSVVWLGGTVRVVVDPSRLGMVTPREGESNQRLP
jgi:hypothetical protein